MGESVFWILELCQRLGACEDDVGNDIAKQRRLTGAGPAVHREEAGFLGQMRFGGIDGRLLEQHQGMPALGGPAREGRAERSDQLFNRLAVIQQIGLRLRLFDTEILPQRMWKRATGRKVPDAGKVFEVKAV